MKSAFRIAGWIWVFLSLAICIYLIRPWDSFNGPMVERLVPPIVMSLFLAVPGLILILFTTNRKR